MNTLVDSERRAVGRDAEDAPNDSDVGRFQARRPEESTNNVPTKRARTLR